MANNATPMKHSEKITALKAQINTVGINRTDKAAAQQELRRLEFLNTPDAEYVAPQATNYASKRVKPLASQAACSDDKRFDENKAPSKEVVAEFMAPTESSPEGWVSAQGVQGRILTAKQFEKILGKRPSVGDVVVVKACLIKAGQWYPSAPNSDSYAQEALVDHWLVPATLRVKDVAGVKREIAQAQALREAMNILDKNVDLNKLEQATRIAANLAKAASYVPAGGVAVEDLVP